MESIAEIRRELTEYLGDNPATGEEMDKVKANNTLSLPGRWETGAAVLRDIGEIVDFDLPDDYWDTYASSVRNLSTEQVDDAADEVIKPANMIWVVVGDRQKIETAIRELEIGEIELLDADGAVVSP
jgi:zinc protease